MTSKKILFSDGTVAYMTYEQVVEKFDNLLNKMTNQTIYVTMSNNNRMEFEDVKQNMLLATWKAFEKYDSDSGYAFSTYLFYWLKHSKSKVISYETRTIRNGMFEYSMNSNSVDGESDTTYMNMIEADNTSLDDFEFNYNYNIIKSELTESEREMSDCLIVGSVTGAEFGKSKGISRQAVNKKLISLRKKMQKIMLEKDLLSGTEWEAKVLGSK